MICSPEVDKYPVDHSKVGAKPKNVSNPHPAGYVLQGEEPVNASLAKIAYSPASRSYSGNTNEIASSILNPPRAIVFTELLYSSI